MSKPGSFLVALGLVTTLAVGEAAASNVTLTFDTVPDFFAVDPTLVPETYFEKGYAVSGFPVSYQTLGTIHLDDSGTSINSSVDIAGFSRFDAYSIDITGLGGGLGITYDNVVFEGFRDGSLVASQIYASPQDGSTSNVDFYIDFNNLDSLSIGVIRPDPALLILGDPNCAPCGHINIDNLEVAAVPLPASGLLLVSGLLMMGRRRAATVVLVWRTALHWHGLIAIDRNTMDAMYDLTKEGDINIEIGHHTGTQGSKVPLDPSRNSTSRDTKYDSLRYSRGRRHRGGETVLQSRPTSPWLRIGRGRRGPQFRAASPRRRKTDTPRLLRQTHLRRATSLGWKRGHGSF